MTRLSEEASRLQQRVSREAQVVTGALAAAGGVIAAGIALVFTLAVLKDRKGWALVWFAGAGWLFSLACLVLGGRLLLGRPRRRDGGLLSPLWLRIAGCLFPAVPLGLWLLKPARATLLLEIGLCFGIAAACWRLAQTRGAGTREG